MENTEVDMAAPSQPADQTGSSAWDNTRFRTGGSRLIECRRLQVRCRPEHPV